MLMYLLSLMLLSCQAGLLLSSCDTGELQTASGLVCGGMATSRNGNQFHSFQGIPFATPPVGQLRFRKPEPPKAWSGVLDASGQKTEYCSQYSYFIEEELAGQEDCLYLNVYSPEVEKMRKPLPVMVWIFGGSFNYGSGTWDEYGPEMFMDYEVILVNFNYRLGPLGFFSLGIEEVPGNQGFHDMLAALNWVQSNIGVFGGDPDQVTIFGESAGSWACSFLAVSPLAKGLFSKAILQSGAFTHPYLSVETAENATRLGLAGVEMLNCTDADILKMVECLVAAGLEDIQKIQMDELNHPVYGAILGDSFLPIAPLDMIKNGDINPIEIIIGTVKDEGLIYTQQFIRNPGLYSDIGQNWEWHGPIELFGKRGDSDITELDVEQAFEALEFYIGSQTNFDESHFNNLTNMLTDEYWYGVHTLGDLLVSQGVTVFQYMFSYKGENSYLDSFGLNSSLYGVAHSDELYFMFNPYWFDVFDLSEDDLKISTIMMEFWTNFAKFGDPTPPGAISAWEPLTAAEHRYLEIGQDQVKMDLSADYQRRVQFWAELMAARCHKLDGNY